jgi:hypothetical protein
MTQKEIGSMSDACKRAYDMLLQSIEDFKHNAPLKWKRWNYKRIKKKKSLRVKD